MWFKFYMEYVCLAGVLGGVKSIWSDLPMFFKDENPIKELSSPECIKDNSC